MTKRPLAEPSVNLTQEFGSYNYYRTEWDATGPVLGNGSLLYRLTGAYQNSDSFRDFVSLGRIMVNPSLTWRPTSDIEWTVEVEGFNQDFVSDPSG